MSRIKVTNFEQRAKEFSLLVLSLNNWLSTILSFAFVFIQAKPVRAAAAEDAKEQEVAQPGVTLPA